jgi:hypothetical protein
MRTRQLNNIAKQEMLQRNLALSSKLEMFGNYLGGMLDRD